MNFELKTLTPEQAAKLEADALLFLWPDSADAVMAAANDALTLWARTAAAAQDIEAEVGSCLSAHRLPEVQARQVVLVRCGDGSAAAVRKAVLAASAVLKLGGAKKLIVLAGNSSAAAVCIAVQALADGTYRYTTTLSKGKARSLQQVLLGVADEQAVRSAYEQGVATVRGVEWAKEWANRPSNHATPTMLAEAALQLASKPALSVEVLGPKEVAKLGMGAFLAVAQGAHEPLRFIVLRYQGAGKSAPPVVLVGKGITFDTGGISLKPAPDMDEMKFDMSGAASVIGAFVALAELQPEINVVGLVPSCENMPDGKAIKPGDVVTSMSGQTIEILNTDAEGRLLLCDALSYAERFKPRVVIDVATLTGACVIALGAVRSGMFANQDELALALAQAGDAALDPCWRMPLDEEYAEGLKSNFADLANVAGRAAGVVTAAKFLHKFVGNWHWAHLDIAGVTRRGGTAKGATGRPVPLLVQYLLDEAARCQRPGQAGAAPRQRRRSKR